MRLWSDSFGDGERIPEAFAFGKHDPVNHFTFSDNQNPHLAWSDLPEGTRSLAVICHDPDVPSRGDDVNQEGKTVSADLPRIDFYHWLLVDLAPEPASIEAGSFSSQVTPAGKSGPAGARGTRQGVNDYTQWFAGGGDMEGEYFGYDGPAPPWNDEIVHRYHFTLYAIDLPICPVEGNFHGQDLLSAIEGHVLGQARLTGTYAIHPDLR